MKKPRQAGLFVICRLLSASYYLPGVEPGPAGAMVEPLGDGLMRVFPDGFNPLFCPAAALPALLVMPVPVALPDVVPPVEDPVVVPLVAAPPVAAPPVAELPLAEPLLDCASA